MRSTKYSVLLLVIAFVFIMETFFFEKEEDAIISCCMGLFVFGLSYVGILLNQIINLLEEIKEK